MKRWVTSMDMVKKAYANKTIAILSGNRGRQRKKERKKEKERAPNLKENYKTTPTTGFMQPFLWKRLDFRSISVRKCFIKEFQKNSQS